MRGRAYAVPTQGYITQNPSYDSVTSDSNKEIASILSDILSGKAPSATIDQFAYAATPGSNKPFLDFKT